MHQLRRPGRRLHRPRGLRRLERGRGHVLRRDGQDERPDHLDRGVPPGRLHAPGLVHRGPAARSWPTTSWTRRTASSRPSGRCCSTSRTSTTPSSSAPTTRGSRRSTTTCTCSANLSYQSNYESGLRIRDHSDVLNGVLTEVGLLRHVPAGHVDQLRRSVEQLPVLRERPGDRERHEQRPVRAPPARGDVARPPRHRGGPCPRGAPARPEPPALFCPAVPGTEAGRPSVPAGHRASPPMPLRLALAALLAVALGAPAAHAQEIACVNGLADLPDVGGFECDRVDLVGYLSRASFSPEGSPEVGPQRHLGLDRPRDGRRVRARGHPERCRLRRPLDADPAARWWASSRRRGELRRGATSRCTATTPSSSRTTRGTTGSRCST